VVKLERLQFQDKAGPDAAMVDQASGLFLLCSVRRKLSTRKGQVLERMWNNEYDFAMVQESLSGDRMDRSMI
jgi:hypothetical protein